jgi:hypothetical protein
MPDLSAAASHPVLLIAFCALWAWISLCLIIRLWVVHRKASRTRKILWSMMLLVPLFGWFFYAGLFHVPDYHGIPAPETPSAGAGGAAL